MGKNNNKKKDGKRKDQSVFKVASGKANKAKNKAKPVKTNLKQVCSLMLVFLIIILYFSVAPIPVVSKRFCSCI